jgi:hypothetical protein
MGDSYVLFTSTLDPVHHLPQYWFEHSVHPNQARAMRVANELRNGSIDVVTRVLDAASFDCEQLRAAADADRGERATLYACSVTDPLGLHEVNVGGWCRDRAEAQRIADTCGGRVIESSGNR